MIKNLVLASNNQHKIAELKEFLLPYEVEVIAPKKSLEVLEDGDFINVSAEQELHVKISELFLTKLHAYVKTVSFQSIRGAGTCRRCRTKAQEKLQAEASQFTSMGVEKGFKHL